jgi:hypothetical protein
VASSETWAFLGLGMISLLDIEYSHEIAIPAWIWQI